MCIFLAKIAYGLYVAMFFVKRCMTSSKTVTISTQEAHQRIDTVYNKPTQILTKEMSEENAEIDLSIIIPVYNCEKYLEDCLKSVIDQKTKYSFEVIIVNDGSTDMSATIINKYTSITNINVINQSNKGAAAARNTGIIQSTGRYIMFVDGDDILNEDCVELLLGKAFEKDYDIVMCAHDLVRIKNGIVIETSPVIYPNYNLMNYKNSDEIMNYPGFPWGKVYKRGLFEKIRFFQGFWYEDTIIQFLIFAYARSFAYIPYVGYQYKLYDDNTTAKVNNTANVKSIDRYGMLIDIIDKYQEIGLPLDAVFYTLLLRHVSRYYYPQIKGLSEELQESLFILAKELLTRYKQGQDYRLPYMLKVTEKAMLKGNINLWKLAIKYQ